MSRRDRDQLDLFGSTPPAPAVQPARQCPPTRGRNTRKPPANPLVAKDVLAEVQHGRFGMLDNTDRVMVFEDDDRVRVALDEDLVHHLLANGYIERSPARDAVSCRHGAVRKPVLPLRLAKRGRAMLNRWTALHGDPA
ncbi:hypothetical protein ABZ863_23465 [Saccharomonospora sp. NPDC046836]|uniref:hypothetical protein n=1 Tax=Saccharomonospora sp. NPDC046836 TaxID=3156921 RepID=UPI00340F813B